MRAPCAGALAARWPSGNTRPPVRDSVAETMEFRILGSLEVRDGTGLLTPPGAKPRALLTLLLLHANEPVSADRIAIALWGEDAPAGGAKTTHVHVSRLRRALADHDVLATTPAGYRL